MEEGDGEIGAEGVVDIPGNSYLFAYIEHGRRQHHTEKDAWHIQFAAKEGKAFEGADDHDQSHNSGDVSQTVDQHPGGHAQKGAQNGTHGAGEEIAPALFHFTCCFSDLLGCGFPAVLAQKQGIAVCKTGGHALRTTAFLAAIHKLGTLQAAA